MAIKVSMVSLGCPKNQIDAEIMLYDLKNHGFKLVTDLEGCDAVIINTCGFIESAKEEAIENIMEMITLKREKTIKAIVVTGCLAERYREEIQKEMPEVDAVIGIGANNKICSTIQKILDGKQVCLYGAKEDLNINGPRILTNLPYYTYLKIAEGCDNHCSYCAIPKIRGKFRSRPMEDVINEAKWLSEKGVKELILVAQDVTKYGKDIYNEYYLAKLLQELCKVDGIEWIRLLYCYPDKVTDELIEVMKTEPKVVKYLDLPLQHCNDEILKSMNRPMNKEKTVKLIEKLRKNIPDVTIRTTFITGYPGETNEQFEELAEFVKETKFDRLGCFAYSEEEGTKAGEMENQVDKKLRQKRADIIMESQMLIMEAKNDTKVGQTIKVMLEGFDDIAECYYGRTQADAPDIDAKVFFTLENQYRVGDFVNIRINDVCEYDLVGEEE